MQVVDKHGEEALAVDSRVMVDGAMIGTVTAIDTDEGWMHVRVDGEDEDLDFVLKPTGYMAEEVESLGDGVNQSMRAAQGQPS